jgi:hypothetical protein
MATIVSPAAYVAAVAALLLSGIGVGLPIDSASADDTCAGAPGVAAPAGQHWYYRMDRVKQRKCWYLHATMPLSIHAAAKHRAEPSEPVAAAATPQLPFAATPQLPFAATPQSPFAATPQATNAAAEPELAADPPNEVVSTQPAPHVTVLAIRPVAAPFDDTTSASQAATPEQASEPPMRQIAANNANASVNAVAEPAGAANLASAPGATDADQQHGVAPADAAATVSARTQSADLFFLLALALGIAAALLALCSKMAGRTRAPRLSEHPDDAWRRIVREEDAPLLAPQEPHGPSDLDAHERIERSPPAPADFRPVRHQNGEPGQPEKKAPVLKDIELALRVLRQARQSVTQT